jgi:hypothetical protein
MRWGEEEHRLKPVATEEADSESGHRLSPVPSERGALGGAQRSRAAELEGEDRFRR